MKPLDFLPPVLAVVFVAVCIWIIAPKLSVTPEADEQPTMASGGTSVNTLIRQVRGFEKRACKCADSSCADKILETMAMWGSRNEQIEAPPKQDAELRETLGKALKCAKKARQLAPAPKKAPPH